MEYTGITYCQDLAANSPPNHRNRPCTQSQAVLWRDCSTDQPAKNQRIQHGGMEPSECGTKTTMFEEIMAMKRLEPLLLGPTNA